MYPILVSLGPVVIGSYGVFLVLAFLTGAFVIWKKGREEHFEEEDLFDAILLITFWGLIGARIGYIAFHFKDFGFEVIKMIALTRYSGLSFLGALPAGIMILWLFARNKKWNFFKAADVFVVGLMLAQILAFGGAFLNGSGYGTRVNLPWAVAFPGVEGRRHPTQLYAIVLCIGLLVLLMKILREYRTYEWYKGKESQAKPGLVFFSYLLGWGLISFLLAWLRPADWYWQGFAVKGWASLGLAVIGLIGGYVCSGRVFKEDRHLLFKKFGQMEVLTQWPDFKKTISKRGRQKRKRGITAGSDVK